MKFLFMIVAFLLLGVFFYNLGFTALSAFLFAVGKWLVIFFLASFFVLTIACIVVMIYFLFKG